MRVTFSAHVPGSAGVGTLTVDQSGRVVVSFANVRFPNEISPQAALWGSPHPIHTVLDILPGAPEKNFANLRTPWKVLHVVRYGDTLLFSLSVEVKRGRGGLWSGEVTEWESTFSRRLIVEAWDCLASTALNQVAVQLPLPGILSIQST